jgi:signal transduction histidine kinase
VLEELGGLANATLEELRDLARGIYPPLLAEDGVVPALEAHVRKAGANATVEAEPAFRRSRFDAEVEAALYFCCVQAIQNVLRHGGNAPARVRFSLEDRQVAFEIRDDGPGFDLATVPVGMGLQIVRDRVEALDGTLEIASAPGAGTTVTGRVPARALEGAPP